MNKKEATVVKEILRQGKRGRSVIVRYKNRVGSTSGDELSNQFTNIPLEPGEKIQALVEFNEPVGMREDFSGHIVKAYSCWCDVARLDVIGYIKAESEIEYPDRRVFFEDSK